MESNTPWWSKYRKRKYKRKNHLTLEMIIRKSFVETVKEYIAESSIAGIRQIMAKENSILQRVLRVCLLCSFLSVVIYFLQYTWVSMLTKPLVVTTESFAYPIANIDFPAIALCNVNRISRKALKKLTLELYPKLTKYNVTLKHLEEHLYNMGRLINFKYDPGKPHPTHTLLMNLFDEEFNHKTEEFMLALAPNCKEMLLQCSWAGKMVDCMSIFKTRRTSLGHCCVFNYVLNFSLPLDRTYEIAEKVASQRVPGWPNGLRVVADALLDDYAYPLSHRLGFDVLMFDSTHFADLSGGRLMRRFSQPNQGNFIRISSIKQIASAEVRKYPITTRQCLFHNEYANEYHSTYSLNSCIIKCRVQSIKSLCKCTPYYFPSAYSSYTKICTLKDLKCLNKYKEKLQFLYPLDTENTVGLEQELAVSLYCPECIPDCEVTQYFVKSYRTPLIRDKDNKKQFKSKFITVGNLSNICVLGIFQGSSEGILNRLDVIAYWFEILSNIGGFSGMLMGVGISTIVEIIYFICIRFVQIIYSNYLKYS